jgi:hypothetical protein
VKHFAIIAFALVDPFPDFGNAVLYCDPSVSRVVPSLKKIVAVFQLSNVLQITNT